MKSHCDSCSCVMTPEHYHYAIDFDGPIHAYRKGLHDGTIYDIMTKGFGLFLEDALRDGKRVIVFTCRERQSVIDWLAVHDINVPVTNAKPIANVYIDDRGFHWTNWNDDRKKIHEIEARGERGFNEK